MKNNLFKLSLASIFLGLINISCSQALEKSSQPPNIMFILADDLGYGDVNCYNPNSKIPTPNLDKLAAEGMRFTDAHSSSTVCSPTRYSILTGRMEFRTGIGSTAGAGVQGPCWIEKERLTLPQMLNDRGYSTACIGKWHLGMSFFNNQGMLIKDNSIKGVQQADFSRPIPDGPINRGFETFFGTVACPTTSWIYAYVEQNKIPTPPTKILDKSKLPDHPYSKDCRAGMIAEDFKHEEVDLVFLQKSKKFIEQHVKNSPDKPFFLYHSMQAVHLPSFPAERFKGKTNYGPHGDFIVEMDYIVGELMNTLKQLGIAENTLVIFASDNGPEVITVKNMRKDYDHDGARPWRGVKRDQWEGGHRTPFIARWPEKIKAGSTSNQLISLTDVMPTCAEIVGAELPNNAAEDGYNMLPVLLGEQVDKPVREYMLQQTITLKLSIRHGKWKYLDHKGSGGNNYSNDGNSRMNEYAIQEKDPDAPGQLYNLETDPGETINLYSKYPELVKNLKAKLDYYKTSGRSAPMH